MSVVNVRQAGKRFQPGDKVRLLGAPGERGAITAGPFAHPGGFAYEVMIGGEFSRFDETQLELLPQDDKPRWIREQDELLVNLLLAKLRHPLTEGLYAYQASRTEFQAYQFRPALKFLRNGSRGLLIADEVGLGKTIEAAIIYLELKARMEINRVLILCPSRLSGKWQDELQNRFEEKFEILDAFRIRRMFADFERIGAALPIRAIASFETMRRTEFIQRWEELEIPLDLLIVDEAHYLRNEESMTFQLGQRLTTVADATLFLSATPLHLGNKDLFNLVSMLAPDEFVNLEVFQYQLAPNQYILQAGKLVAAQQPQDALRELQRVEETALKQRFTNNPYYRMILDRLRSAGASLTLDAAVAIQRELMELNTLASVLTRTRKREMTAAAVRSATTVKVELTPNERRLYDAALEDARTRLTVARSGAPAFGAVMQERQAASCLPAMLERICDGRRLRKPVPLTVDRSEFDLGSDNDGETLLAGGWAPVASPALADSKFRKLDEVLEGTLRPYPDSKALIFSYFRDTLDYLERRLRDRGWKVAKIHGGVKLAERRRIIEQFRDDDDCQVMLSSEVGAEGLDFQFCDTLINYDLPWNPMQVEQRIGRLDRFGQQAERIRIFNFYLEDTIETRIFQRLYDRIGIFVRSIGDLEAILGEEMSQLTREVLQRDLTPDEQTQLAIQSAERIIRLQQEAEVFEQHRDELIGQSAILDRQVEEAIEAGNTISGNEVRALVSTFIRQQFDGSRLRFDDEEPCATLEMDPALSEHLMRFIERKRLGHRMSNHLREAMGNVRKLAFTYDSDLARRRPNLEFVTVHHPLAEMAREFWSNKAEPGIPSGVLSMQGCSDERGDGYFFVHLIDVKAARPHVSLKPVIVLDSGDTADASARRLLAALHGEGWAPGGLAYSTEEFAASRGRADEIISVFRQTIEREAKMRNEALLIARRDALQRSFDSKIQRATDLRQRAIDARIKRMRDSQVRRLEVKKALKLAELEEGRVVLVKSQLIIGGRIQLRQGVAAGAGARRARARPPAM